VTAEEPAAILAAELTRILALVQEHNREATRLEQIAREYRDVVSETGSRLALMGGQLERAQAQMDAQARAAADSYEAALILSQRLETAFPVERRVRRLLSRFKPRRDLWPALTPPFEPMQRDSMATGNRAQGFVLTISAPSPRGLPLRYPLRLKAGEVAGLMLAPVLEVPVRTGTVEVSVVSPEGRTEAQSSLDAASFTRHGPETFLFPPVRLDERPGWSLFVVARGLPAPLMWYELQRRGLFHLERRPFFARIVPA
jgi:hypothetical protein